MVAIIPGTTHLDLLFKKEQIKKVQRYRIFAQFKKTSKNEKVIVPYHI